MGLVVPLGFGPDEPEHAYRAFQIALGDVFPHVIHCISARVPAACGGYAGHLVPLRRVGGTLPTSLVTVFVRLYTLSHHRSGLAATFKASNYTRFLAATLGGPANRFANFENTALYSPINYLPEILVFWIAQHTGESLIGALFSARLLSGMVWAALVTAAVAITPRWKWLFALVVLIPTALSQSAVINADAATLGVMALTAAYALRLADRGTAPTRRQLVALILLGVVLGLMKFPLVLALAAVAAIVWPVLGNGRHRAWRVAAITLPGAGAAIWWDLASNAYFVPYRNIVYSAADRVFISQPEQEHHLLTHIYELPAVLWTTAIHGHLFMLWEVVGTLGEVGLPEWFAIIWIVLFVILAIGSEGPGVSRSARGWIGGTLAIYFLATALALYLTWTRVGADQISGMHGRYFTLVMVFAVPLLAGLGGSRIRHRPRAIAAAAMTISALATVTMFTYTAYHYYGQGPWQVVPKLTSVLL